MSDDLKVYVVDDHEAVRDSLEALLVSAGDHSCSTRSTCSPSDVSIGANHPLISQTINIGCRYISASRKPNITISQIIDQHDDEVGGWKLSTRLSFQ